jgi:4-hydroxy-3-methylbut-2-enyl diphosphate reductase
VLVIGAPNSSNSVRLVEVALKAGARDARLIASADAVDWRWFDDVATLAITAGASAPEDLVQGLIAACSERFAVTLEEVTVTREDVVFKLPRVLAEA